MTIPRLPITAFIMIISLMTTSLTAADPPAADPPAADPPAEGKLDSFLGEPELKIQPVFQGGRFPNVVVTMKGTILATWGHGHIRARRSEDGGTEIPSAKRRVLLRLLEGFELPAPMHLKCNLSPEGLQLDQT